jgi:phage N-6-adenine-methyltransferase
MAVHTLRAWLAGSRPRETAQAGVGGIEEGEGEAVTFTGEVAGHAVRVSSGRGLCMAAFDDRRDSEVAGSMSFVARNHPQQVLVRGVLHDVDDRQTTPELFDPLNEKFGFTVDVAASELNKKCDRYYTIEDDGLAQSWAGEVVWCNPPYSDIQAWVVKAWAETEAKAIVMLLPANRTEQGWWQDHVEPYRDIGIGLRTEFLRGRLRFIQTGNTEISPNERPPFGCVLLIWEPLRAQS